MKFDLPFSVDTVNSMIGQTIVLSKSKKDNNKFEEFMSVKVKDSGEYVGGFFSIGEGRLRMMGRSGLFGEFSGVEVRGDSLYLVGELSMSGIRDGNERITLHEQKLLKRENIGICISSHVDYEKVTLPILLSSIRKSGADMSDVMVVVGGYKGEKEDTIEGAKVYYRETNNEGFGGLFLTDDRFPYWLMLHDTSEADRDFVSSIENVDVGLKPDVIRLRSDGKDWMGFYSSDFINKIRNEISRNPDRARGVISSSALIITTARGKTEEISPKDIYGTGKPRLQEQLPVGIRKYSRIGRGRGL